jgi:serpin B
VNNDCFGEMSTANALTADVLATVRSINALASDWYLRMAGDSGSLIFSPSSIYTALSMAYAGARGDTAAELEKLLRVQIPPERHHEAIKALSENTRTGGVELRMANRFWAQAGYAFLPAYLDITETYYKARLAEVDFKQQPNKVCEEVNCWVAEQTAGKITDILSPHSISSMTRLVLANAVYFLGRWEEEFEEFMTGPQGFKISGGKSAEVQMMHQTDYFGYAENDEWQAVELPYKSREIEMSETGTGDDLHGEMHEVPGGGSDFAMVLVLPRQVDGLSRLTRNLRTGGMQQWTSLATERVNLSIPRFKAELSLDLVEGLRELGLDKAFSSQLADFSGMASDPEGLYLGAALHKAFVEVNERGTEAAAANVMVVAGGAARDPVMKRFAADHPFLFFIHDRATKVIHFMGSYAGPVGD